jgi:hypothetical protein
VSGQLQAPRTALVGEGVNEVTNIRGVSKGALQGHCKALLKHTALPVEAILNRNYPMQNSACVATL